MSKTVQVIRNEWACDKPLKPAMDVYKWIEGHSEELEKNISAQPTFLSACGEANVTPQKKFSELLQNLLNSKEPFWTEFRDTFRQTIGSYSQRMVVSEEEKKQFIENALFSSFSRIVRAPLSKKLA